MTDIDIPWDIFDQPPVEQPRVRRTASRSSVPLVRREVKVSRRERETIEDEREYRLLRQQRTIVNRSYSSYGENKTWEQIDNRGPRDDQEYGSGDATWLARHSESEARICLGCGYAVSECQCSRLKRAVVVNMRRDDYDVRIDRRSKWGNPFRLAHHDRDVAIASYRQWLLEQHELLLELPSLRGKKLGCWCKPAACHGDILAELANNDFETHLALLTSVGIEIKDSPDGPVAVLPRGPAATASVAVRADGEPGDTAGSPAASTDQVHSRRLPQRRTIAIVGSRDYPNLGLVTQYVRNLPPGVTIVSGGARGVDKAVETEARSYPDIFTFKLVPAQWNVHGKSAGFIRNEEMVRMSDKVVAFWDELSRGTHHTISLALDAGLELEVYGRDGREISPDRIPPYQPRRAFVTSRPQPQAQPQLASDYEEWLLSGL